MVDLAPIRLHHEAILELAERHGARDVRIFGSMVRGEAGPQSAVDFLVELAPGRTLLDWSTFWQELKRLLGRPVDVATERSLRPELRARAIKEALPTPQGVATRLRVPDTVVGNELLVVQALA